MKVRASDRASAIFFALSAVDPDQRTRVLDEQCNGDPVLRAEVEGLLNTLADLQPRILAAMHGSTFVGDGGPALRSAADMLQRRLGAAPVDAVHAG